MPVFPTKEQPGLRDIFAANVAGQLLCKSEIKIDSDEFWLRKIDHHSDVIIQTIAFISYRIADALISERVKKD